VDYCFGGGLVEGIISLITALPEHGILSRICSMKLLVMLEHLQEFAKIHLANLVIWQVPKLYGK
jgi:hypothetical protein